MSEENVTTAKEIEVGITSEIVLQYLRAQRDDRRWTTVKRFFVTIMIAASVVIYASTLAGSLGYRLLPSTPTIAVVPINGVIANSMEASADSVITVLERLFDTEAVEGIVLLIDSGGGSPSEAERITRFIDAEKERTGKKVIAACAGMCASAAYMIAVHADKVYAGEYSWTGSIGAIMKGWDVNGVLEKFDVAQRVFTSGAQKDLMNPYTPMSEEMSAKLDGLVNQTAKVFSEEVTERRGGCLPKDKDLFTGEVWTGAESLELCLVDAIGTVEEVLATEFEGMPHAVYRPKKRGNTLFDRVLGYVGTQIAEALLHQTAEVRLQH